MALGYNYDITSEFGLGGEVGWSYYGKVTTQVTQTNTLTNATSQTKLKDEFSAWDVAAVATWHVTPSIDLLIKGDMADVNSRTNALNVTTSSDVSANRWKPLASIGAGYDIEPNIQVNITYTRIFGDNLANNQDATGFGARGSDNNRVPTLESLLVGLKYTF